MVAMVDNSPPSATFFDINERNPVSPVSPLVRSVGQSSHELLQEMGTWPMRSASKGGIPTIKLALELQVMQSIQSLLLSGDYFWSWSTYPIEYSDKARNACGYLTTLR